MYDCFIVLCMRISLNNVRSENKCSSFYTQDGIAAYFFIFNFRRELADSNRHKYNNMGLAGTKVKQRFGLDPRNTNWSNDTSRFGHQYLESMGWTPGKGLGLVDHAMTSHVKVTIKEDNMGLGAKLGKRQKKDEFDNGECSGLDVFQRILGRLNGKEDKINNELDRQRKDNILNGKWGMHFIRGEVLLSTWDGDSKKLLSQQDNKKRSRDQDDEMDEKKTKKRKSKDSIEYMERKEKKKEKKSNKEKRDLKEGSLDENGKKIKSEKKEKRQKKEKKHKKEKKDKKEKKEKKGKKEKKEKKDTSHSLSPSISLAQPIASRLAVRSRWIKQKRASVMDAKALNEIFMIAS